MPDDIGIVRSFLEAQDQLVLQASDLSLETIATMVLRGAIDIAPAFQRRERWQPEQQAALIESFLLNIPVPPVYLSEEDFGRYSVIDGKQRIITATDFLQNNFALKKLETFTALEGMYFRDLPMELQNALSIRPYLRVITLLRQTHPDLKYQVFLRLNRGGEMLNAQEIRNVAFRGPLNEIIYDLSAHPFLRQQLKIMNEKSSAFRSMADAEYVLRYLTLRERWQNFSGSLSRSMDEYMMDHLHANLGFLGEAKGDFERSMHFAEQIWGEKAFKRPVDGGWRDLMIAGMYDAQMIALGGFSDPQLEEIVSKKHHVVTKTIDLVQGDETFDEAIRTATNTPSRIRFRVNRMGELLGSVLV